jgi:hypothetical protein
MSSLTKFQCREERERGEVIAWPGFTHGVKILLHSLPHDFTRSFSVMPARATSAAGPRFIGNGYHFVVLASKREAARCVGDLCEGISTMVLVGF